MYNLLLWCVQAQTPLVSFPATALVVPEPLGVVLIFSCWNLPLGVKLALFAAHAPFNRPVPSVLSVSCNECLVNAKLTVEY